MKLSDLLGVDATINPPKAGVIEVSGLAVDSRAVKPGDLFFALDGTRTDGSKFID
ncbi:MAG: Mur ligase domain-containing protein, partial [Bradyrhizobium sp.]